MSKVELTISSAVLNKNYDFLGKMENYVKVVINNGVGGTSEFKTRIVPGEKDKATTWNESFSIPMRPSPGAIIEFSVMDEDMTSNNVCKGLLGLDKCGVFRQIPEPHRDTTFV